MTMTYLSAQLLIDGEFLDSGSRMTSRVENPANNEFLGEVPHATAADLDRALAASQRAFESWRKVQPGERGRILRRAAELLHEREEHIARLITLEVGKTLAESRWEIMLAAHALEWFAEEARRTYGRVLPSRLNGATRFTVVKEPVGPIASFAPWNWPVDNAAKKIGAALAAGCTCIHKPAEEAPASALEVARALVDAGLPPGVLSMVYGVPAEISEHLLRSPVVRKVSFTGSIPVGKHLMKLAADGCKRTTMELGGHAPVLVFDDVDVDAVLDMAMLSKFRNAGQVCVSPTRFYVQERIYERFVDGFAQRARGWTVGDGLLPSSKMGPLAHARQRGRIEILLNDALTRGARLAAGGRRIEGKGYFFEPTILADVPEHARIMNEEPFGPVAVVNPFSTFEDGIAKANCSPVGLAAYGFSENARIVARLGDELEAGMVALNSFAIAMPGTPFLGIKESGHGAENGIEGVEACLVTKVISQA
jgi:succinate-semialdehyde dehydrogenase/glutarate-semialdehyde dehydrogenase